MRIVPLLLLLVWGVAPAQKPPLAEYTWAAGNGAVSIASADLDHFGQSTARFEIDWTPGSISSSGGLSQNILRIPNTIRNTKTGDP